MTVRRGTFLKSTAGAGDAAVQVSGDTARVTLPPHAVACLELRIA
jgi:hypothetical protein